MGLAASLELMRRYNHAHGPWRSLVSASDWGQARLKRCADLRKRCSAASGTAEVMRSEFGLAFVTHREW
jgi:hypothetical protein